MLAVITGAIGTAADLALIAGAGTQIALIGTAAFGVAVLIWSFHKSRRVL